MDINDAGLAGTSIEQLIRAADISNPMTVEGQAAVADLAKVGLEALSNCADTLKDAEPGGRPAASPCRLRSAIQRTWIEVNGHRSDAPSEEGGGGAGAPTQREAKAVHVRPVGRSEPQQAS